MRIHSFGSIALVLSLVAVPAVASAAVSIDAGGAVGHGTGGFAGSASLGLFGVPVVPLSGELTFMTTANGDGSAGTFDLRLHAAGTTIGAGAGVGNIGLTSTTAFVYDGILAQTIAPHTAIETRMYFGPQRPSTFFAGLRFTF